MIQNTPNPLYTQYKPSSQGVIPSQVPVDLKNSISQKTEDNPAVKATQDSAQDPRVLAASLGIWGAMRLGIKPLDKAMAGNYETSLLGKIGSFGDKISTKLNLDRFNGASSKFSEFAKNNKLLKYFTSDYKTTSVNKMASFMEKGTLGELASDAGQVIDNHLKQSVDKLDISEIKKVLASKFRDFPVDSITDLDQLKALCKQAKIDYKDIIINNAKENNIQISKLFDIKKIDDYIKNPLDNIDDIVSSLKKAGGDDFIEFGSKVAQRKVYYTGLANKLTAISKKGANSSLGKTLSKGYLRTMEGLTNGMAGGPWAILIQAFCFAQAAKAAIDAPKGEKLSTFTENVFNDLGYYLVGTSALNLTHRFTGNKYRGLSPEKLKEYKSFIKSNNEKIISGVITDKAAVKEIKTQAKQMLKEAKPSLWERPLRFAGKILGSGLDKIEPVVKQSSGKIYSPVVNFFKKLPSKMKGFPGGALRFGLVMMVITPALVKPVVKLSHLIFGRPTKSVLDKDTENKDKQVDVTPASAAANSSSNYLDNFTKKENPTNQQQNVQSQQPASQASAAAPMVDNNEIAAKKIKPEESASASDSSRKYVPSSEPTKFDDKLDTNSQSSYDALMKKANDIEQKILKSS